MDLIGQILETRRERRTLHRSNLHYTEGNTYVEKTKGYIQRSFHIERGKSIHAIEYTT